jgi:hypothetical protein
MSWSDVRSRKRDGWPAKALREISSLNREVESGHNLQGFAEQSKRSGHMHNISTIASKTRRRHKPYWNWRELQGPFETELEELLGMGAD